MQKNSLILQIFLVLSIFSLHTFSQTYEDDSLAVRAILDSNGLNDIPVNSVADSSGGRIVILHLDSNSLTAIPSEIGNLTSLQYLYLFDNSLSSLPAEIENLTYLMQLDIDRNNLDSIPSKIGNLSNLTYLGLSNNNLASLPLEIGNLTELEKLYLDSNSLTNIPTEIGNLTKLIILHLNSNSLTTLPDSIVKLTPNVYLDLGYNSLDTGNLSVGIIAWADKYDPDWKKTQTITNIYNPTSNIKSLILSLITEYPKLINNFYLTNSRQCQTTGLQYERQVNNYFSRFI